MEASYLSGQQGLLFVLEFKMLLQTVDIKFELFVLFSQFRVELLLEVEIPPHIGHLSIPEVELIALMAIVLLCHC